ncbi:hypothetical protein BJ165DRAFT_1343224 [Panaeolus papilionaceus]|nr:hypothetical protein BJ165DRAFT_1343224 [Panaeolus papilionaceus]
MSLSAKLDIYGNGYTEKEIIGSDRSRLTKYYPAAYMDFYGMPSNPPCVYKSGPAWREGTGPEAYPIARSMRPVYDHPIAEQWEDIGESIYALLDSQNVRWTSMDPVGFAEEGVEKPFCSLLIWIGVYPKSLSYDAAVAAAEAIKKILTQAGFPEIEVAFRESVVTRSVARGPKLLPFDTRDPITIHEVVKPFTPTLGLSIATLNMPYYEGTGALYFCVSSTNKRTVLLTAAHIAHPPASAEIDISDRHNRKAEKIIALGSGGFAKAIMGILGAVGNLARSMDIWNDAIATKFPKPAEGEEEDEEITKERQKYLDLVDKAKKKIEKLDKLYCNIARFRVIPEQRIIGSVLHVEPITVSDGPHKFTRDWALVELDPEMIDWDSFEGNKVYIGGNLSQEDFCAIMFPRPEDRADCIYPCDGLLQANGIVKDEDMRSPQQLDADGEKCLHVVKNGLATGTTVGRVNGLHSFTRVRTESGINETSLEVAVLPFNNKRGAFSAPGDSGAIVLERGGGIVGMITSGSGTTEDVDITYVTPYWWLDEQIEKVLPDCYLYDVVQ